MSALVSVIAPFYNVESFIEEFIESVLAQDMPDFELLLIDDRSPDKSRLIAERLAARDPRIRIITHGKNQGLGPARNTGVRHAKGEYLMFIDSDDRMASPQVLGELVRKAQSTGNEVVVGSAQFLMSDGALTPYDRRSEGSRIGFVRRNLPGRAAYSALIRLPGANYLPLRSWGYLYRTDFYRKVDLDQPAGVHEDIGHTALVCSAARNVHVHEGITIDYRIRQQSLSKSTWSTATIQSYLGVWRHFRDNHDRFGLSHMKGNAALHLVRNACWMLERNGIKSGDEEQVLQHIGEMLADATDGTDDAMAAEVQGILFDKLRGLGLPGTDYIKTIAHLPTDTAIGAARHQLGIFRHA